MALFAAVSCQLSEAVQTNEDPSSFKNSCPGLQQFDRPEIGHDSPDSNATVTVVDEFALNDHQSQSAVKTRSSSIWDFIDIRKSKAMVRVDNNHASRYIKKKSTPEKKVLLTLTAPYGLLHEWQKARAMLKTPCSFVDILNDIIPEKTGMRVKLSSQRIEERMRRICSSVKTKLASKTGRQYEDLKKKEAKLAIQLDDLNQGELDLEESRKTIKILENTNDALSHHCDILTHQTATSEKAASKANEHLMTLSLQNNELNSENKKLRQYIEQLGQDLEFTNNGAKLTDVGERQQRRKLKELKTNVEKALWFSKTFGLELNAIHFNDASGAERQISFKENTATSYKNLTPEEKQKVCQKLQMCTRYCFHSGC